MGCGGDLNPFGSGGWGQDLIDIGRKAGEQAIDIVKDPIAGVQKLVKEVTRPIQQITEPILGEDISNLLWQGSQIALPAVGAYHAAPYVASQVGSWFGGAPAAAGTTGAGITGAAPLTGLEEAAAGWSGITGAAPLAAPAASAALSPGTLAASIFAPTMAGTTAAALPAIMSWPEFEALNLAGGLGGTTAAAPAATGGVWDWIAANPLTSAGIGMMGANLLSSGVQADMMQGMNEAQRASYQEYLDAINPPEAVKDVRYDVLAEQARTQASLAQKKLQEELAQRGVRGKGTAAPTGDLAEAERKALNAAYNQIYGTYNVPSTPGPVDYAPSATQLTGANMSQMLAQGIPLALILSKYGIS